MGKNVINRDNIVCHNVGIVSFHTYLSTHYPLQYYLVIYNTLRD